MLHIIGWIVTVGPLYGASADRAFSLPYRTLKPLNVKRYDSLMLHDSS